MNRGPGGVKGERRRVRPGLENLEGRQLLAGSTPELSLLSTTTADSQSVTVSYEITGGDLSQPVPLGVYRSHDAVFDPADEAIDTAVLTDTTAGVHTVTIPLKDGLPPEPQLPNVLVVADPTQSTNEVDPGHSTVGFVKHTVAVVTHGGMQSKGVARTGPWWQRRMAAELESQGYETVIPFNWVNVSRTPGAMETLAPRLAARIRDAVEAFPAGEPVDVHLIGHSEGAVLNSLALQFLDQTGNEPEAMKQGYVRVTMLDPHSASTGIQGQQYSVSNGLLGTIAKAVIDQYQSQADDPPPFVPASADDAEVFFQRTHTADAEGGHHGWYNLWGQVPVVGDAHYFDLTGHGLSHSGKFAVYDWYILNVVPQLGTGAKFLQTDALDGELTTPPTEGLTDRGFLHVNNHHLAYQGDAAPGSVVRLMGARPQVSELKTVGRTIADENGHWSITTRPLYSGMMRAVATARLPHEPGTHRLHMRPVTWMGNVIIDRSRPRDWVASEPTTTSIVHPESGISSS